MALYRYRAQSDTGETLYGKRQAADEQELQKELRREGKFLLSASVIEETIEIRPLKSRQVAEFCREVGTLLGSGVSLVRALKIIAEDESIQDTERVAYERLLVSIRQGVPLSHAMEELGDVFPSLLIYMFRSAEAAGNIDKMAMKMSEHYTKEYHLNNKVKSALIYPKILLVVLVAVIVIIMTYVIPQFETLFSQMETLPAATEALLGISDFVRGHWIGILIAVVALRVAMMLLSRVPRARWLKDKLQLSLPVIGKLYRIVFTARFARTLHSLYTAGIPILTILQISRRTIGNAYIETQFDDMIRAVRAGEPLHRAISGVDGFTNKLVASVKIGEETGKLDNMLSSAADNLDYEADVAISKMMSYLEPMLIIAMAVIVGFIMIAVIQPIYGSYETIGQETNY